MESLSQAMSTEQFHWANMPVDFQRAFGFEGFFGGTSCGSRAHGLVVWKLYQVVGDLGHVLIGLLGDLRSVGL